MVFSPISSVKSLVILEFDFVPYKALSHQPLRVSWSFSLATVGYSLADICLTYRRLPRSLSGSIEAQRDQGKGFYFFFLHCWASNLGPSTYQASFMLLGIPRQGLDTGKG